MGRDSGNRPAGVRGAIRKGRQGLVAVVATVALVFGGATAANAQEPAVADSTRTLVTPADRAAGEASQTIRPSVVTGFDPGNIISDAVFFDSDSMTTGQIQAFLDAKGNPCRSGYTCLRDYRTSSTSQPASPMCSAYSGRSSETAAEIIARVAKACGINPQVLLVTLQKEQGLVTASAPSSLTYRKAMGQGCPDTSQCNAKYYGFFNQVYGAARQFKRYANPPGTSAYYTWYAPGRTWDVLYHPNRACGTSRVAVRNQATANLYYYTPYQPNRAALAAGYSIGDSCSSYGNRNFYNYFTDWFGTTQGSGAALVKVGTAVWMLSGTERYHVTAESYPEYRRVFGAPRVVDNAYLSVYSDAGRGSFYVRNAKDGTVAYLQDGRTHRFPSCGMVSRWGGSCGSDLVQLTDGLFEAFGAGPEMSDFVRVSAGGRIHQLSDGNLTPLFSASVAASLNRGKTPYAAVMRESVIGEYSVASRVRFAPAAFLTVDGAPEVWLATYDGRLLHLPSWSVAAELGLPGRVTMRAKPADIAGYTKAGTLSIAVLCGSKAYIAAGGVLSQVPKDSLSGLAVADLGTETCRALDRSGPAVTGAAYLKADGAPEVYRVQAGTLRHIVSPAQLLAANGGRKPTILSLSPKALGTLSIGPAYPTPGTLVRTSRTPEVWVVDGIELLHLPTWAMAREYGLPTAERVVSSRVTDGLTRRTDMTLLSSCDAGSVANSGRITSVASTGGAPVTPMTASLCDTLPRGGSKVGGALFVSDGSSTAVATGGGFLVLKDRASILRANGGVSPDIMRLRHVGVSTLDGPSWTAAPGALVRSSSESAVTLVSGDARLRIPSWAVARDLGIVDRYRVVGPANLANIPIHVRTLGPVVRCDSTLYVAAGGVLSPISRQGLRGITEVALSAPTCATLDRSGPKLDRLIVKSTATGKLYVSDSGFLRRVGNSEDLTALAGTADPPVLLMEPETIQSMFDR